MKVYNTMVWYMHSLWKDSTPLGQVNASITSPACLLLFFLFLVRTFKFYFLSKFQLHNTVLSTIVTMSHIRSSGLIPLIIEFVPFYQPRPIPSKWPPHINPFFSSLETHKWNCRKEGPKWRAEGTLVKEINFCKLMTTTNI